jgi:hypothetical protein
LTRHNSVNTYAFVTANQSTACTVLALLLTQGPIPRHDTLWYLVLHHYQWARHGLHSNKDTYQFRLLAT